MRVLFSRRQNDFEHVYDLPSVPRVGEHVGLLESPIHSFPQYFVVTSVYWSPDHTAYDVSVSLALECATDSKTPRECQERAGGTPETPTEEAS